MIHEQFKFRLSQLKSVTSTKDIVMIHGLPWLVSEIKDTLHTLQDYQWRKEVWKTGPALVHKRSGNITFYQGQKYNPKYFDLIADSWTHDHCYICFWRLDENEDEEHGVGYVDDNVWICQECYKLFIEKIDDSSEYGLSLVEGDLLDQDVEVIVNPWDQNMIPWWLLLPQGVSGAIKKRGGYQPFWEVGRRGSIPLGQAVLTSAGRLPYKGIIHVAGINMFWRASEQSIHDSVVNAMKIAREAGFQSIAFPLIGTGSGGFKPLDAMNVMLGALKEVEYQGRVMIVVYKKQ